ncbi:MAG: lipase family protein [Woeseiaceae bacterium]
MSNGQQKPLPQDQSFESLFAPNKRYEYLSDASSHPFDFRSSEFRMVNAWWLAELSMLVYVRDESYVRQVLAGSGLTLEHFHQQDDTSTQYLLAANDSYAVVAFRGTEVAETDDIATDIKIPLVASDKVGRVHKGFKAALDSVWLDLNSRLSSLSDNRFVWFTGHSLGAALATLAADRFDKTQGVYTFGSPRAGDKTFRDSYKPNAYRFRNNNDIVTRVPPRGMYAHVGEVRYIDHTGRIHSDFGVWKRLRDRMAGRRSHLTNLKSRWQAGSVHDIPVDELVDHAPIYYVVNVWNDYQRTHSAARSND